MVRIHLAASAFTVRHLASSHVCYDHQGLKARMAVELTPDSALNLVEAIQAALARGATFGAPVAREAAAKT